LAKSAVLVKSIAFLNISVVVPAPAMTGMCRSIIYVSRRNLPRGRGVTPFRISTSRNSGGVWGCTSTLMAIAVGLLLDVQLASAQTAPIRTLGSSQQTSTPANTEAESPGLDPVLARAKSLADNGRATEAEHKVRQYLAAQPKSASAHFLLGYILFREIQEQALVAENAKTDSAPTVVSGSLSRHTPGIANLADESSVSEAAFRAEKSKASLAEFTEGAKYHTPSAFDLKIVAFDYVLLEDYMDADKWFTKMLEWNPNDSEGWYQLGRTKYNENRFAEAVRAFQRCLKLDPNNVKAEDNLGLSFAGLGRVDDAASAYQNAMAWQKKAVSKNAGPFIDMADLLLDQNRSAEAISYLTQAIEISPRDFKAHELMGKAYSRLDQLPQAQSELEQAIALAPQNPNLPCMLGPIYRRQGLMDNAKAQLDRCTALNGTHSSPESPRP
jgi:Flp pilus assembly protein TadD